MKKSTMLIVVLTCLCAVAGVAQDAQSQGEAPLELDSREELSTSPQDDAGGRVDESTLTFAEEGGPAENDGLELTSFGAADFIRMLLVLGFVVAVIYALFYVLKRSGGRGAQESRMLRVLGTTPLQSGRSIHLIEIGGRVFVVGSSENSVNLISEIDTQETIDELLIEASSVRGGLEPRGRRFGDLLTDIILNRREERVERTSEKADAPPAAGIGDTAGDQRLGESVAYYADQKSRLQRL